MSEQIHEVQLTIFQRFRKAEASSDPARITLGDSLRWKVLFDEGDGSPPSPDGPRVEIRFTDPGRASGPFAGLYDEEGAILGRTAERSGRDLNYHVFLEGEAEPLAWTTGRKFGGLDVGEPPP